ncbi:MAG TPA: 2-C-methyl-D-erythritol 4-phosphate cytidylyltransferase [Ktedonobacterales bacterium]
MTSEATGQTAPASGVTVAVILCAGQGTRMRADRNKVLLPLLGKSLIAHTLAAFERATSVDEMLLVAHPDEVAYFAREVIPVAGASKISGVIAGGATRHQSEQCALDALRERITTSEIALVMIHDGARPLVAPEEIDQLAEVAREGAGAILVTPIAATETLLETRPDGAVALVAAAEELARAQTPQAFDARLLLAAYDQARLDGFEGTDTASSLERLGYAVRAVYGSDENIKVTTPDDLLRAAAILRARSEDAGS